MDEPVGYGKYLPEHNYWVLVSGIFPHPKEGFVPVYTHPMRELTEDEIREVADSVCHTWKKNGVGELYMTDFAKAILKKASEK